MARIAVGVVVIAIAAFSPSELPAMELKVAGYQLILSGRVVGDEPGKVTEALAKSPEIDTVILRNSPGGNAPAGYQVGQLLRERGLRTAVSGHCYSSCSRMFLGGRTRYFTDDYPPEDTNVGFHGHYYANGRLNSDLVDQYHLRDWIIRYSDGRADPQLVERWINIPYSRGMIHFFHPGLLRRAGDRPSCVRETSQPGFSSPVSRSARPHSTSVSSRPWISCAAPTRQKYEPRSAAANGC
jgi:hypothetical protein